MKISIILNPTKLPLEDHNNRPPSSAQLENSVLYITNLTSFSINNLIIIRFKKYTSIINYNLEFI